MRHLTLVVLCAIGPWVSGCTPTQVRYEPSSAAPEIPGSAEAVLYLVGDAGEVSPARDDVLSHLEQDIEAVARGGSGPRVVVAFLGDNIYDEGLPLEPSDEDLEKLEGQITALPPYPNVEGIFLPGNHDWSNGGSLVDGRAAVERQSDWVERRSPGRNIRFLPDDGCPGPATRDVGSSVHLVFIDTEWLLRSPEGRCGTASDFYSRLTEDLLRNANRQVIILSHHPLVSGGPHGGNVAPFQSGPLVYYLARKSGASVQDLSSGRYSTMVRRLREAIAASGTRPLAQAAGHDHTLQVVGLTGPGDPAFQLVSGAASKSERSRRIDGMRYATDGFGYMRLEVTRDLIGLTVFARDVGRGPVRAVFACRLSDVGSIGACPGAPLAGGRR